MPYDIWGNTLAAGHCEVHPWVHCPYPCPTCESEAERENEQRRQYEQHMQELYERDMERLAAEETQGVAGDGI